MYLALESREFTQERLNIEQQIKESCLKSCVFRKKSLSLPPNKRVFKETNLCDSLFR